MKNSFNIKSTETVLSPRTEPGSGLRHPTTGGVKPVSAPSFGGTSI